MKNRKPANNMTMGRLIRSVAAWSAVSASASSWVRNEAALAASDARTFAPSVPAKATDAASIGNSWAFDLMRRALDSARLARETPWSALGRLGQELGIGELSELAASVALAGTEGAKVRASLAAKAASLRTHELAEAETADQAATERMSLPIVMLFAGFLFFIGFPAVERVLTGL